MTASSVSKREHLVMPSWLPIIDIALDRLKHYHRVKQEDISVVVLEELRDMMASLEPLTDEYGRLNISTGDTDENS